MQIKKVPTKDLISPEWNPRQITTEELEKLKTSLEEFGYIEPIIVNDVNNHVVGGNQRLRALIALGYTEVDCVYVHIEDINKEKACNVALNKISGDWDEDKLRVVLEDIELSPIDIKLTGFDELELTELEVKEPITVHEDDFIIEDEEDMEVNVQEGDLFKLGEHYLLCGDSTVEANVKKLMQGAKADMVFTDPPYNVEYTGGMQFKSNGEVVTDNREMIKNDNKDIYEDVFRILSKFCNSACYIWFADTKGESVYKFAEKYGTIHSLIIWVKNGGYGALNANYKQKHEPCLYWNPKGTNLNFIGATTETTIWEINKDGVNNYHPTQKPVALSSKAIQNHKCESVLDLFGGSGSTLIACEQLNRNCYMMELDPYYCQVIINRWEQYTGEKAEKIN